MATRINSNYRDALIQQIKDAGQELINRAETLVHPDLSLLPTFIFISTLDRTNSLKFLVQLQLRIRHTLIVFLEGEERC